MANFEMLDPDEQALMKKPRPIGWFAAGGIFILAAGFALGVYLPLQQAHDRLLVTHEQLAKKSSELDTTLRSTKKTLEQTDSRKNELEKFVASAVDTEKALSTRTQAVSATAEDQLKVYFKSKLVEVRPGPEEVSVVISERILFRPGQSSVNPQAKRPLCGVAKAFSGQKDWRMEILVRAAADDKDFWETASERAGAVAAAMESSCGVPKDVIFATAESISDKAETTFVEFVLKPNKLPRVKGSEAPKASN